MSSAEIAVRIFRSLEPEDLQMLHAIETGMNSREYVPKDMLQKYTKFPIKKIDFELNKLDKLGLVYRMQGGYVGYTMNYAGYDCLAINTFVKSRILDAFGEPLGVGKEADVFGALTPKGVRVAVKFHQLGRISFRQTRRKRSYMTNRAIWLLQSAIAAEREFEALKLVHYYGVAVPEPILQNRHAIVMGVIEGGELGKWRDVEEPDKILMEILVNVRRAFLDAGVIHGDLSEYNVILRPDMHVLIIDWPQFVRRDHPNAEDLLRRDITNILSSFSRKFKVEVSVEEAYSFVSGKTEKLFL